MLRAGGLGGGGELSQFCNTPWDADTSHKKYGVLPYWAEACGKDVRLHVSGHFTNFYTSFPFLLLQLIRMSVRALKLSEQVPVRALALKEAMPSRQVQTRIAAIRSRIDPPLVFMRLLAARLRSVLEVVCLLSSSSRGALPGLWRTILEDDVE